MTDENTRLPSDSVVEALRFWNEQSLAWMSTRYDHAKPGWMEVAIAKGTAALQALAAQPRDDVCGIGEGFARLQAAKERLQRCRDELNFAIEQVIDSQVELTALAPTTQGTDSGLADAAVRVGKVLYGDDFDPFQSPENFDYCEEIAKAALAEGAGK